MIAILYKNGKIEGFIENVISISANQIIAVGGGAKGVSHSVLIIDEGFLTYETGGYPILTTSKGTHKVGDNFDPSQYKDCRSLLPQTKEQQLQQQIDDLTLMIADMIANGGTA